MGQVIRGVSASDGIGIGKAYILESTKLKIETKRNVNAASEYIRLDGAVRKSQIDLQAIRQQTAEKTDENEAVIFDAQLLMLEDEAFIGEIKTMISKERVNAEAAIKYISANYMAIFENMENHPYMQDRVADIHDISERLIAHLLGVKLPDLSLIDEEVILVAEDLTPSETAQLDKKYVKGFVTDLGGKTSHSAIIARNLEIPSVVGSKEATLQITQGEMIIVDASNGEVIINPTSEELVEFGEKQEALVTIRKQWETLKNEASYSKDGKQMLLLANMGVPKDMDCVLENGAEGIGLYRTEFIYMTQQSFPSEEEQYEIYASALKQMPEKPVTVRTLDIGGDKALPYMDLPNEMNPFLGYRAIRISLDRRDIFRTQLRALLRASVLGQLKIMFPMVSTLEEFREAKSFLEEIKEELLFEGHAISENIEVGLMVEVPSVALMAEEFAKEADFFSIGTNDLTQYTMAADRLNERVSSYFQTFHPAIIKLIKKVVDASHAEGKWTGVCGEMAGDSRAIALFLGMGVDECSMSSGRILQNRYLLRQLDSKRMANVVNQVITECETEKDVLSLLEMNHLLK